MTSFDFSRYYLGRPRTAKPERHPDFEAWLRRFYGSGGAFIPVKARTKAATYKKGGAPWQIGANRGNTVTLEQVLDARPSTVTRNFGGWPNLNRLWIDVDAGDESGVLCVTEHVAAEHVEAIQGAAGGGFHVSLILPPGAGRLSSTIKRGKTACALGVEAAVDTRAADGYVVAAESFVVDEKYPEGGWYTFEYFNPGAVPIPMELVELLKAPKDRRASAAPAPVARSEPEPAAVVAVDGFGLPPGTWDERLSVPVLWRLPDRPAGRRVALYECMRAVAFDDVMAHVYAARWGRELAEGNMSMTDDAAVRHQITCGIKDGYRAMKAKVGEGHKESLAVPVYIPKHTSMANELHQRIRAVAEACVWNRFEGVFYIKFKAGIPLVASRDPWAGAGTKTRRRSSWACSPT